MQTSKSRTGSLEVPHRTSPKTPRTTRQLKTPSASESDSASSGNPPSKTTTYKNSSVPERRSPRSPMMEKKRPSRVTELESQIARLQEDLKKVKEQLGATESCKLRAQQEADDAKKQLVAMAANLEESQQQLLDLSASEEARLQELRKISQERDRAWESELEALQNQHSADSAALSSTMNEIQRLKLQLEAARESEATHTKQAEITDSELQSLKQEMAETLSLVEDVKAELRDSKEAEAHACAMVNETLMQLERYKTTVEMFRSDGLKAMDSFNAVSAELEESRAHANSLEEIISKLKVDLYKASSEASRIPEGSVSCRNIISDSTGEVEMLKAEVSYVKTELEQFKSALEAAEIKYQEEQIQATMEIQSSYELLERTKSESNQRESQLEAELKKVKEYIVELKANLMDKETELQGISAENEGLSLEIEKILSSQRENGIDTELKKAKVDMADLKVDLKDKESQLQSLLDENKLLKLEIEKRNSERGQVNAEVEAAQGVEMEPLVRLNYASEESDKSTMMEARVAILVEQVGAARSANMEMESELKRLRIQSDQWRKAAETAASMLSGNNGKLMERSSSLDGVAYNHPVGGKVLSSAYSEVMEEDSMKKNNNVLRKFGGLWKKGSSSTS